jgi:carboxyl-terminal processing protease
MATRPIGSYAASCSCLCGAALALFVVCARLPAQTPKRVMPDSVRDYVTAAMAAFRTNSVHRGEVNWASLEDSVFARAAGAQVPAQTWRALTWALRRVDPHSFLMPPEAMMASLTGGEARHTRRPAVNRPLGQLLDGRIGLVVVPPHSGRNRPTYVDSLQAELRMLDSTGVCGWVVDLREDTGGNMWPMLAGIGPLLGAEMVGSFTGDPPNVAWRYHDGRSWSGDSTLPAEPLGWGNTKPRQLAHADAPVALLIGSETASSGEMVLLAFLGRHGTRTFGDSTAGFASANTNVRLRDGATLVVTSSYPRDRLGRTYPLRIAPDELVAGADNADAPLRRAVAWLLRQPPCAGHEETGRLDRSGTPPSWP